MCANLLCEGLCSNYIYVIAVVEWQEYHCYPERFRKQTWYWHVFSKNTVIQSQNVLHLIHNCISSFIVLIVHPRQVLILGVNKLSLIWNKINTFMNWALWSDQDGLYFVFFVCIWSSWFSPLLKSMLPLWCVCLKSLHKKQIKIATMSQHQFIINTKQLWCEEKLFINKSKENKDRLTHQWFECGWFTSVIIVMCMSVLS